MKSSTMRVLSESGSSFGGNIYPHGHTAHRAPAVLKLYLTLGLRPHLVNGMSSVSFREECLLLSLLLLLVLVAGFAVGRSCLGCTLVALPGLAPV